MTALAASLNSRPTLRLHIERLVLDGLPHGSVEPGILQTGLEQELTQLLTQTLAPDWTAQSLARLDAQPVTLASTGGSAAWGHQIARTLMTALAPPSTQQPRLTASANRSRQIG